MSAADLDRLGALRWHWGEAYMISIWGGRWRASRADRTGEVLSAHTQEGLRDLIIADYTARPVSRDLS